jgi:hypothetical protein
MLPCFRFFIQFQPAAASSNFLLEICDFSGNEDLDYDVLQHVLVLL